MSDSQIFSISFIVIGLFGIWLESQCKLGQFVTNIEQTPNFAEFVVAVIVFLVILSVIGEPYSSILAGVTILGLLYADYAKNGSILTGL